MAVFKTVDSDAAVFHNIRNYETSVPNDRTLRGRMRRHPAWYAFQDDAGSWHFGPSKFVGYEGMTVESYLDNASEELDGKETEPVLKAWFDQVEPGTDLHAELLQAFAAFAGKHGTSANKRWRVSVPKRRRQSSPRREAVMANLSDRIVSDPAICGGRPTIKGTRIRVSDLVEMVANGMSAREIVEDFPQLESADVSAALQFAARYMDHAVVYAA